MIESPEAPFDEPWQARAFALAQGVLEATGLEREEFRSRLVAAIAEDRARPYWTSWVVALERLVTDHHL